MKREPIYEFGLYRLDGSERALYRSGHPVDLRPKDLEILLALVEQSGHIVKKDHLMEKIWPGTFVEEGNLSRHISTLREILSEGRNGQDYIETIPRRGYRFTTKVTVAAAPPQPKVSVGGSSGPQDWAQRRSIAVLPFTNLSGKEDQEHFADGMTEALTLSLSRINALRVISRTSAMLHKRSERSLPQIARILGADFIIEGSVAHTGSIVRISAQLIRATDDSHIWAEKYDGQIRDILRLQDRVAVAISESVAAVVSPLSSSPARE